MDIPLTCKTCGRLFPWTQKEQDEQPPRMDKAGEGMPEECPECRRETNRSIKID